LYVLHFTWQFFAKNSGHSLYLCMPKILAIDYGQKRCGIAITDDLKMIASPLETVDTKTLVNYLLQFVPREKVDTIVIGESRRLNGEDGDVTQEQNQLAEKLAKVFPKVKIDRQEEQFSSKLAVQAMVIGGMKKSDRQKKENIDKIAAAIILQDYLNRSPAR
jgi:putative Holliday junction resolvase